MGLFRRPSKKSLSMAALAEAENWDDSDSDGGWEDDAWEDADLFRGL